MFSVMNQAVCDARRIGDPSLPHPPKEQSAAVLTDLDRRTLSRHHHIRAAMGVAALAAAGPPLIGCQCRQDTLAAQTSTNPSDPHRHAYRIMRRGMQRGVQERSLRPVWANCKNG